MVFVGPSLVPLRKTWRLRLASNDSLVQSRQTNGMRIATVRPPNNHSCGPQHLLTFVRTAAALTFCLYDIVLTFGDEVNIPNSANSVAFS